MSQRNVEVHDRVVEAVNAREVPEDVLAPGFRMENRASAATDYTYYGARGWNEWMSDLFESFADGPATRSRRYSPSGTTSWSRRSR